MLLARQRFLTMFLTARSSMAYVSAWLSRVRRCVTWWRKSALWWRPSRAGGRTASCASGGGCCLSSGGRRRAGYARISWHSAEGAWGLTPSAVTGDEEMLQPHVQAQRVIGDRSQGRFFAFLLHQEAGEILPVGVRDTVTVLTLPSNRRWNLAFMPLTFGMCRTPFPKSTEQDCGHWKTAGPLRS